MSETLIETRLLLERVITDFQSEPKGNAAGPPTLISSNIDYCETVARLGARAITPEAAAATLQAGERLPVAVIDANALFETSQQAVTLVSHLRDVCAEQVLVIGSQNANTLDRGTLTSLGFHRWQKSLDGADNRTWFIFDLAHYKVTPDWLNPRHWANPELWDKYRW